jgi:hypothetical protein
VFDHPGLRVMIASPDHIFAMKALAARATSTICAAWPRSPTSTRSRRPSRSAGFPDEDLSPRALGVLQELFE